MARQQRKAEGDENEKRKAAREARAQGKRPSEVGATQGASKQTKSAPANASHQEKLDQKHEGKRGSKPGERARPGNRETDPKRTERWG